MSLSTLVSQTVAPVIAPKQPTGKKVSPEKLLAAKKKADKKQTELSTKLTELRAELKELSGAPVSPLMTADQIVVAINKAKNPEPVVEEPLPKIKDTSNWVKPSKPQGIGVFVVERLKAGIAPIEVLKQLKEAKPTANTSIGCVYAYVRDIKVGLPYTLKINALVI